MIPSFVVGEPAVANALLQRRGPRRALGSRLLAGGGAIVLPDPTATFGSFDGLNSYVTGPVSNVISSSQNPPFSICSRVRFTGRSNTNDRLFSLHRVDAPSYGSACALTLASDSTIQVLFVGTNGNNTGAHTAAESLIDRWVHLLLTYDGSTARVYFDGIEVSSFAVTGAIEFGDQLLTVGAFDSDVDEKMTGDIAEFQIFDDVLIPDEVLHLYTNGASGTNPGTSNLLLDYDFDDGNGTQVTDKSGNGNHGTAVNITEANFWNPYV